MTPEEYERVNREIMRSAFNQRRQVQRRSDKPAWIVLLIIVAIIVLIARST